MARGTSFAAISGDGDVRTTCPLRCALAPGDEDSHVPREPHEPHSIWYGLTFYAWATPGSVYPFHCHILAHLMNPG